MGIFDKLWMGADENEQARQLNKISYINALNTHNQELQQKLQVAENAQRQSQEQLGLFFVKIGDRGYYVCEAVWKEIETLRKALKPFAAYADQPARIYENETGIRMALINQDLLTRLCQAAADAIRESGE